MVQQVYKSLRRNNNHKLYLFQLALILPVCLLCHHTRFTSGEARLSQRQVNYSVQVVYIRQPWGVWLTAHSSQLQFQKKLIKEVSTQINVDN